MFTKTRYILNAGRLAVDPDDPDGQWIAEAARHGYHIGDIDGCHVPIEEEGLLPGTYTVSVEEVRLAQYIGGRLFIETVPAIRIDKDVWISEARIG